jgi:hypothetical protein
MMDLGMFQQAIQKLGNKVLPAPVKGGKLQIEPGEHVLITFWKEGALTDQLYPKWKGSYSVIWATSVAVKVHGIDSLIYLYCTDVQ